TGRPDPGADRGAPRGPRPRGRRDRIALRRVASGRVATPARVARGRCGVLTRGGDETSVLASSGVARGTRVVDRESAEAYGGASRRARRVPGPDGGGGEMSEQQLGQFVDRYTMRYERVYPHPVERVWEALTSAEALDAWMMPINHVDARAGGPFSFSFGGPDDAGMPGAIGDFRENELVDYRLELEPS